MTSNLSPASPVYKYASKASTASGSASARVTLACRPFLTWLLKAGRGGGGGRRVKTEREGVKTQREGVNTQREEGNKPAGGVKKNSGRV